MKFLKVITVFGELAINEYPNTVEILSVNQKASVTHPMMPAVIAPSLALFVTKYIENAILKYHKALNKPVSMKYLGPRI